MKGTKDARLQKEEEEKAKEEQRAKEAANGPPSGSSAPAPKQIAPLDRVPKGPKNGYAVSPSMVELSRMSLDELLKVEEFEISNEFGSITFLEPVDLTDLDLADLVTIVWRSAEVYDDDKHKDYKHPVGEKINRPALIKLRDMKPKKNQTSSDYEERLKSHIDATDGGHHMSYDGEKFTWEFRVDHFTKWGPDEESEDEDAPMD